MSKTIKSVWVLPVILLFVASGFFQNGYGAQKSVFDLLEDCLLSGGRIEDLGDEVSCCYEEKGYCIQCSDKIGDCTCLGDGCPSGTSLKTPSYKKGMVEHPTGNAEKRLKRHLPAKTLKMKTPSQTNTIKMKPLKTD